MPWTLLYENIPSGQFKKINKSITVENKNFTNDQKKVALKMNSTNFYDGQGNLYNWPNQMNQSNYAQFVEEEDFIEKEPPVKKPKKKRRSRAKDAPKGRFFLYLFCTP